MEIVRQLLVFGLALAPPTPGTPQDCAAYYYGDDPPRDYVKALACYRAAEDWLMVAVMQLNGEGTPVDVAAARATFNHDIRDRNALSSDHQEFQEYLVAREANPKAKAPRIDYSEDIAETTRSTDECLQRVIFKWKDGAPHDVKIDDYH